MQIFLARNNKQAGPYTLEQLNTMLTNGQVQLSDLAWHEGMENWQQLGDITGGQLYYTGAPNSAPEVSTPLEAQFIKGQTRLERQKHMESSDELKLADVGTRIGAKIIDQLLFLVCLLPALPYISMDPKAMDKVQTTEQAMAFYQKTFDSLPSTVGGFIMISYMVLLVLQLFLLAKKGQTIGKILLGIRIVDYQTNTISSVLNVVAVRTLLTETLYMLAFPLLMIIDTIAMFISSEKRSLHDRIARTKVLVAHDDQLNKTNSK